MEFRDPPLNKNYFQRINNFSTEPWDQPSAENARRRVRGSYLNRPITDTYNEHGRGNGLRYGVASVQGWRGEMEDTHSAVVSLGQDRGIWRNVDLSDWSYFGVFDGHAGDTVSNYCADRLLGAIVYGPEFQEDIPKGLRAGFLRLDNRLRRLPDIGCGKDKGSSTAVCALISPFNIYVAHCGDSRAVICNDGKAVFSTPDHKPCVPLERKRIERAGGFLTLTESRSGLMTVSRSFGDFRYKSPDKSTLDQIITVEPDIKIRARNRGDFFMVLACNGVWDVMDSDQVISYVGHLIRTTEDLESVANTLINTCIYKGSRDSVTAVIITFPGAPKPLDKVICMDKNLDRCIENKVKELLYRYKYADLSEIIEKLYWCDIPNLPPGAGLGGKLRLIETVYNQLRPYHSQSALCPLLQGSRSYELEEAIFFH